MAIKSGTERLGVLVDDETGLKDDVSNKIRDTYLTVQHPVVNAADEFTLVPATIEACYLQSCSFVPESSVAAGANSLDGQLYYNDGAGGAGTALSSLYDGTASAVTADQSSAFVQTAAHQQTLIPAGSRIYVNVTVNGGGDDWDGTVFLTRLRAA